MMVVRKLIRQVSENVMEMKCDHSTSKGSRALNTPSGLLPPVLGRLSEVGKSLGRLCGGYCSEASMYEW